MRMLNSRTIAPAMVPPRVEMKMKSHTVRVPSKAKAATPQVHTPMTMDITMVSTIEDSTLARRIVPFLKLISKVPMLRAVPILLPIAPKMFPRIPMAE